MKKSLNFTKMQGTGNSFIFVDARKPEAKALFKKTFGNSSRRHIARHLCHPHKGIGADGFAIFENTGKGAALQWDFYNADGSKANMCGNAARCAGLYITNGKPFKKPILLRTGAGVLTIRVNSSEEIDVEMTPIKEEWDRALTINKHKIQYDYLNTGVPHVVIQVKKLMLTEKYRELSRKIQKMARFGPQSTNVTFYEKLGTNRIATASFERGVNDFTLACGTGAVAAAASFHRKHHPTSDIIKLKVPGGVLKVNLSAYCPRLIGPAVRIADFKLYT